ncbi:MAG: DUF1573 domain-containing protein [Planctomycetales bacterium]|nr:DUF1573 domain-containing protein [Planctomycetales bacterium]
MISRRRYGLAQFVFAIVAVLCFLATPAMSKEWARKMFETTSHDFGTVARGALAEFDFVIENIYEEKVHIASVRSSCGCTEPSIVNADLATWEKGAIRARFNTKSFVGHKSATITVVIDKPYPAEVQLTVRGMIRSDVVFQPGSVEFGDVDPGESVKQTVLVKYAGRSDWRIVRIQKPEQVEIDANPPVINGEGRISYAFDVRLRSDVPEGYWTDQIILETNDGETTRIPFTVSGNIRPSLTVSPASVTMGVLRPGEKNTKQLVIRGKEPFRITGIDCGVDCFEFRPSDAVKRLHFVPITFTAGDNPGEIVQEVQILTDLDQGTQASCLITATVKPAE